MPADSVEPPRRARHASQKPSAVAPVSPRKIRAGNRLNGRNPTSAPARIIEIEASAMRPVMRATPTRENAAMSARPAESPSSPSTMLNAFVTPTIQKNESGIASQPMFKSRPRR